MSYVPVKACGGVFLCRDELSVYIILVSFWALAFGQCMYKHQEQDNCK